MRGDTPHAHIEKWLGSTDGVGGLKTKPNSAKLFSSGQKVAFQQEDFRLKSTASPSRMCTGCARIGHGVGWGCK